MRFVHRIRWRIEMHSLQPRFDSRTAKKHHKPRYGVAIALQPGEQSARHKLKAPKCGVRQQHDRGHRRQRSHSEDRSHKDYIPHRSIRRWVDQERNERFAGAQQKDREEDPGRACGRIIVAMGMKMLTFVHVFVRVNRSVRMHMSVPVRPVSYRAPNAPCEVH